MAAIIPQQNAKVSGELGERILKNWIRSAVTGLMLERPAQKLTLKEHAAQLSASGKSIREALAAAGDSDENRDQLVHIIGIERWGQRRLRVILGEPLLDDDSDDYLPSADLNWAALQEMFRAVRQETLDLIEQLTEVEIDTSLTIPHNEYGKLTPYAWLRYLEVHSTLESKRIK